MNIGKFMMLSPTRYWSKQSPIRKFPIGIPIRIPIGNFRNFYRNSYRNV